MLIFENHMHEANCSASLSLSFSDSLHLERNDLTGSVDETICDTFALTFPVFSMDCVDEVDCDCCLFCCADDDEATISESCQCQLEDSSFDFLCAVDFGEES